MISDSGDMATRLVSFGNSAEFFREPPVIFLGGVIGGGFSLAIDQMRIGAVAHQDPHHVAATAGIDGQGKLHRQNQDE